MRDFHTHPARSKKSIARNSLFFAIVRPQNHFGPDFGYFRPEGRSEKSLSPSSERTIPTKMRAKPMRSLGVRLS